MSLSLEGIGAVLQKQDDVVVIREIVPGGPAARSNKLEPGDRVVAVGQGASGAMEDVVGWRIDDVVDKIRGAKGTQVRLDVIPPEAGLDSKPVRIVLTRDKIKLSEDAAKAETITIPASGDAPAKRIGVIKLPGFYQDFEGRRSNDGDYASATRDVARLLQQFRAQKVDGVVMDLRNNGGGSLDRSGRPHRPVHRQGPGGAGARIRRPRQRRRRRQARRRLGRPAGGADQSRLGLGVGNLRRRDPGLRSRPDHRRDRPSARARCRTWSTSTAGRPTRQTHFGQVKLTIAQFFRPAAAARRTRAWCRTSASR